MNRDPCGSLVLHAVLPDSATDQVAIVQEQRRITYQELDRLSSQLAALLVEKKTKWPTPLVGVSSTVTIETVVAILGILKAGLAYVPLDVRSPPDRLKRIVRNAQLQALLLDPLAYKDVVALASESSAELIISADLQQSFGWAMPWSEALRRAPLKQSVNVLIDDLAYVLYTSGSTGEPKGVMLTHRNARTFVNWMAKEFEVTRNDRIMSRSPLNFDLSVFDIFNAFYAGATLIIHDGRQMKQGDSHERHQKYVEDMRKHRVTILYTTPSTFTTLLDKGGLDPSVPLRLMLYAGEPFRPPLLKALMLALPKAKVANIYGPTETNIVTCYWVPNPPEGTTPIPIGIEVDDTEILIVNDQGELSGPGEVGELWVRGGTVCLGYLGKEELTAQRLVKSPFHSFPAYFWRTGDYGYRRQDRVIVYFGRIDNMVKVKGYRVELGDIESALSAVEGVSLVAVIPRPDVRFGHSLTAMVVAKLGHSLSEDVIRKHLQQSLPEYMVPQFIEMRADLPTTSTGKVDRQRLIADLEPA